MSSLDHKETYEEFKARVLEGIQGHFPIVGGGKSLTLEGIDVDEDEDASDNLREQHKAKVEGKSYASSVYATMALRDREGKVVDKKRMRVAEIPYATKRHSFIVGGQEYQVDNQWQLKPGVYTRRSTDGTLKSQFNTPTSKTFSIFFEPNTKQFLMERGKSKRIPVYSVMKAMGVDDDTLERKWGKEIFEANKNARGVSTALEKVFKADKQVAATSNEEAQQYLRDVMGASTVDPEVTKKTLGRAISVVDGDALVRATDKILRVNSGEDEDDRDSLEFKRLRGVGDYAKEHLLSRDTMNTFRLKVRRKMQKAENIRDVVKFGMLNNVVEKVFKEGVLANPASQINPVEMAALAQQTTVMGPGGIQSENALRRSINVKLVNPSHLGFLDPVRTPESQKTGAVLRLPLGVQKSGGDAKIRLYNVKTGKDELVSATKFAQSNVVMPDQVTWEGGKPKPIGSSVKVSKVGNDLDEVKFKDADYVFKSPSQLFSLTTNLVPFMGSNSGNRASYAGQHLEQAISLKYREAPLVQVGTGSNVEGIRSFEEIMGRESGHIALKDGVVVGIKKDAVLIKGNDGKIKETHLYNNFPLNDPKGILHSEATVKVGDKVKAGQSVGDTNFTKDGKLALGTNLRVAYIPYKGYNFEDGVVISQSAAKKLTSEHLHKELIGINPDTVTDPTKFKIKHPEAFSKEQHSKLDERGVVRIGQKVNPGDPLVLAMTPFKVKDSMSIAAVRKSLGDTQADTSLRWKSSYPGEVVAVSTKKDGSISVHVRTEEPMQVGDKITGRHGNKGIVTMIVDDDKMPRTKDGKHIEVALNPSGVPGRMNVGQVLETAAAKIAEKTKKPFILGNFSGNSAIAHIKGELKKHGLTDQEELVDPETGQVLGKALVGPQHMLKLVHQIDKKTSVRSGMAPMAGEEGEKYDLNLIPSGSGKTGAQTVGHNGMYTLLAHGAKANLREMQTWKSEGPDRQTNESKRWPSQHEEVWRAIQTGEPLPTPKTTFSFHKFTEMLKGAGINMEKRGNELKLMPFTDKQVLAMSNGEITNPGLSLDARVDAEGELRARKNGLFDPKVTGGHGGKGWGHIKLPEPLPNPVFENAIRSLTGLNKKQFDALASGEQALDKNGTLVELGTSGSHITGEAFKRLLGKIDVKRDLEAAKKELSEIKVGKSTQKVDALVKKVKYLRALDEMGVKPEEAYIIHHLPVVPPAIRPVSIMNGSVRVTDLNQLYRDFGQVVNQLKNPVLEEHLTEEKKKQMRANIYDGLSALMGTTSAQAGEKTARGILHQIAGVGSPKRGYFQETLLKRKTDLSMRSTIIPEPSLELDEIGLPKDKALSLYKPFVVRKLVEMGAAKNPLDAHKLVKDKSPYAVDALELVAKERPVLVKRDPALHKHSIQAFRPKIMHGNAIRIHPLTTSGYNADFDGDTMSAYVPISDEAVKEARGMFPSSNLYNEASGKVIYTPTLEMALGLYKTSRIGETTNKTFKTAADAVKAVQSGKIGINDVATISGRKTTTGRVLLASALPEDMQESMLNDDPKNVIDKKGLGTLFSNLAKNHKLEFGTAANRLKDIGNGATYGAIGIVSPDHKGPKAISVAEQHGTKRQYVPVPTHSLSLDDFDTDVATRTKFMKAAEEAVKKLEKSNLKPAEKEQKKIDIYSDASEKMMAEHMAKRKKNPTNLSIMVEAGVKPSGGQYQQMVLAPVLMKDASGRTITNPVVRSYSEGLDTAQYWTQMHGARGGTIKKVQEVEDPGVFSKRLMQVSMASAVVADTDCGTTRGISMPVGSKDIYDRVLASDFSAKGLSVPKGTVLTPDIVAKMRAADKSATPLVRSTLKCEHEKGVCQKCAGVAPDGDLYRIGTNLGVISAQSLGERSVQLTLKAFHCLHEHSVLLVKNGDVVAHTTIKKVVESGGTHLMVWDAGGWSQITGVDSHIQQTGTSMALVRTRSGNVSVSQDNHPHMLRENDAVCTRCGSKPKKSNGGKQYYCRKCNKSWQGEPVDDGEVCMVSPSEITRNSHRAVIYEYGPEPTKSIPQIESGWLAGMFCAEGCVMYRNEKGTPYRFGIYISQRSDSPVYDRIGDELERLTGKRGARPRGHQVYSVSHAEVFETSFGRYSKNKGLPDGWSGYSDEWLASFVSGVIDGDGTVQRHKDSRWCSVLIDTTSFLLAQQLRYILRKFGTNARIIQTPWRKSSLHQGLRVSFVLTEEVKENLKDCHKIKDIPAKPEANEERFTDVVDYVQEFRFATTPVVYDISTETGTFFVDGMLTHNSGGVSERGGSRAVSSFARVQDLTSLPKRIPNAATVAMRSGTIDKIENDSTGQKVWIGGKAHHIGKDTKGNLLSKPLTGEVPGWIAPKVGMKVEAGTALSDPTRTVINPHDYLKATGSMERVQNLLTDELYKAYKDEGVRRPHVETVVRSMGQLTKILDPGDAPGVLRGEFKNAATVRAINRDLQKRGKRPIMHAPTLKGIETMPLEVQEDWMAKMMHKNLKATVIEAASTGAVSDIHGTHPAAGLAYGAEFGLNKRHALKPGLGHLKDVAEYAY